MIRRLTIDDFPMYSSIYRQHTKFQSMDVRLAHLNGGTMGFTRTLSYEDVYKQWDDAYSKKFSEPNRYFLADFADDGKTMNACIDFRTWTSSQGASCCTIGLFLKNKQVDLPKKAGVQNWPVVIIDILNYGTEMFEKQGVTEFYMLRPVDLKGWMPVSTHEDTHLKNNYKSEIVEVIGTGVPKNADYEKNVTPWSRTTRQQVMKFTKNS